MGIMPNSRKPLVSILIPTYNRCKFIAECIDSALAQTYENIEIILVDNASSDETWEICKSYAQKSSQIKIYRNEENIGPVRNWIRCLNNANGEFVKFLFSDDKIYPTCIEKLLRRIKNPNIGFAYCSALIGKDEEMAKYFYHNKVDGDLSPDTFINKTIQGQAPISPGAVLMRTADALENLHLSFPTDQENFYQQHGAGPDLLLLYLTAIKYEKIAYVSESLVFFRAHSDSITVGNKDNLVRYGYQSAISYFLLKNKSSKAWLRYIAQIWLKNLKHEKKALNFEKILEKHGGKGQTLERFALMYEILCYVLCTFAKIKRPVL
jgi:glycosyltransferase involved in cell wall biosynthesis